MNSSNLELKIFFNIQALSCRIWIIQLNSIILEMVIICKLLDKALSVNHYMVWTFSSCIFVCLFWMKPSPCWLSFFLFLFVVQICIIFIFSDFKFLILYWSIADLKCCDSFRWTTRGPSHTFTLSILPQTPLPSRLPHNVDQSSLCYTVCPCWLST